MAVVAGLAAVLLDGVSDGGDIAIESQLVGFLSMWSFFLSFLWQQKRPRKDDLDNMSR